MLQAVVLLTFVSCATAVAQEQMSRHDTAAILFSNRFSFTPSGEPVLSVALMEDQSQVEFSSGSGVIFYPSGPGGPEVVVSRKGRWNAQVKNSTPAKLVWRVVLASVPTTNFAAIRSLSSSWNERGVKTTLMEVGTIFSFQGTTFDTRQTWVCTQNAKSSRKEAEEYAAELGRVHGGDYSVTESLVERPHGKIVIRRADGSIELTARDALWFEPSSGNLTVYDVEHSKGFSWHGRETRTYRGSFYLAVDRHGKLAIVNVLDAEALLKGLVPAEIYPDAPPAALRAQAIAARNELFSKIGLRHLADPFLLCAEQHCQVYKGVSAEREHVSRAVEATRGQVLFDQDGRLADARYHSTCGGHTEDAAEVWPKVTSVNLVGQFDTPEPGPAGPISSDQLPAFLKAPPDTWCGRSPKGKGTFRWTRSFTAAELDKKVNSQLAVGKVLAIDVLHRGVSGRATLIKITGDKSSAQVSGELEIRALFGGLKSSMFVVEAKKDPSSGRITGWTFTGGGFGHGVGMCQLGAIEMAKQGKSTEEILHHYYKAVTIKRIY